MTSVGDGSEDDKEDSDERTEAAPGTSRVGSEPGDLLDSARKDDSDEGSVSIQIYYAFNLTVHDWMIELKKLWCHVIAVMKTLNILKRFFGTRINIFRLFI